MAPRWAGTRSFVAVVVVAATAGFGAVAGVDAAAIEAKDFPESMHGAVETQAITAGQGALALFVDPGTAYAYSVFDRDDYGEGSVNYAMTARGANLNLGTIAYAVLWAAPDCANSNLPCYLSGQYEDGAPNTGLHEAKGFPAYAEALYPPPPEESGLPSQERVYKCVINKDGTGSPPTGGSAQSICKSSDAVPLSAWAETIAEEYRATGFSRAGGFDAGVLKVGGSESYADTRPLAKGRLLSVGRSSVTDISLLGGAITIESVKSTAQINGSASGGADRSVSCTFTGLTVGGQRIATTGGELPRAQLAPLLAQIANATGVVVELVPPSPVLSTETEGGKQVAECSGMVVRITDTRTSSPVPVCLPSQPDPTIPQCLPGLATREEYAFGKVAVQQSVNELSGGLGDLGDTLSAAGDIADEFGGTDTSGGGFDELSASGDLGGSSLSDTVAGTSISRPEGVAGSQGSGDDIASGDTSSAIGGDLAATAKPVDSATIGLLAASAAAGLIVGVLVLIGTISSLAAGRAFRLPGL